MQIITLENDNNIIEGENVDYSKSKIDFKGEGNILFLEGDLSLGNSNIDFKGNNSIVFLRSTNAEYRLKISIFHDSVIYFGLNSTVFCRKKLKSLVLNAYERKNIFIGNDVMFSHGIRITTSDAHLIYSTKTLERKNYSKSIFIGDHVWIGREATLLKGTQIFSGSIIGSNSLVSGKIIKSNTSWAGNPAKLISEDVFWVRPNVNKLTEEESNEYDTCLDSEPFIFKHEPEVYLPFDMIDKHLKKCNTAEKKCAYLIKISSIESHNRFAF